MKTIYKLNGYWADCEPSESDTVQATVKVPADVDVNIMNTRHYADPDYSENAYNSALKSIKLADAKNYLATTDYISTQWRDEEELGLEHRRTAEDYKVVLEKRQEARELIRSLSIEN